MPTAILQEWTVTDHGTPLYDALVEKMDVRANPPPGLIVHTAGFSEDGKTWTIFDVWETEADFERFQSERLMPAIQDLPPALGGGPADRSCVYELHGFQLG